jgi:hypothetical protein
MLDFNSYRRPEMVLVLKDKKATVVHVTTPTKQLVDELRANLPELQRTLGQADATASRLIYQLAAKLLNCNLDGLTFTGDELAKKYRLNLEDMAIFYATYSDFLKEIEHAKN